ncbi:hypothetical protein J6590_019081 [Homalodisca vitripennis]|nr:hypothetical protein J6590_019081 [Homalodisca vitripennis]
MEYGDENIKAMVLGSSSQINSEESEEKVYAQTELVSHSDTANALDLALCYVEQHTSSTPNDVMFMQRWRNITSSSQFTALAIFVIQLGAADIIPCESAEDVSAGDTSVDPSVHVESVVEFLGENEDIYEPGPSSRLP